MIIGAVASAIARQTEIPALRWLDACAAPGGKTTAILSSLPDDAFVVANEYDPRRASILSENLAKWGAPNVAVTRGDTVWMRRMRDEFHVVSVDAPCSGEGMMRKEPQARLQWSERLVESCAALQREILANAWEALMPGGYLIYSTCTFNRRENEENVLWMAGEYGAESVALTEEMAPGALPSCDERVHALRFVPGITEGEGLFLAVLRKPGSLSASPGSTKPRKKEKKEKRSACPEAGKWLRESDRYELNADEAGSVSAIPAQHTSLVRKLRASCRDTLSAGVNVATVKGRDLIPAPELALSTALLPEAFPSVELNSDEALDYLRRGTVAAMQAISRKPDISHPGYMLVKSGGLPLGFVKYLGNRLNNLYPTNWRLRE